MPRIDLDALRVAYPPPWRNPDRCVTCGEPAPTCNNGSAMLRVVTNALAASDFERVMYACEQCRSRLGTGTCEACGATTGKYNYQCEHCTDIPAYGCPTNTHLLHRPTDWCACRVTEDCSYCGQVALLRDLYWPDGRRACWRCFSEIPTCEECGENLYRGSCPTCTRLCKECGTRFGVDDDVLPETEGRFCPDCRRNAGWCTRCDDYAYLRDDDRCSDCYAYADDDDDAPGVHDYSYRPEPRFFGHASTDNALYMGFELEVECHERRESAEWLADVRPDLYYLKHDGSLDNGIEIVSHPGTFAYWMAEPSITQFEQNDRLFYSYKSYNTGFHIHMSKAAFGQFHLYRFMRFHYDARDLVQRVAQRQSNGYASFDDGTDSYLAKIARKDPRNANMNRYVAVNCQNADTIELRYFKGNIAAHAIRKNLQFAHAVYMYTQSVTLASMSADGFTDYLSHHVREYRDLAEFLKVSTAREEYAECA